MVVKSNLNLNGIMKFAGHHIYWLGIWMASATTLYHLTHWQWLIMPWLPVSVIATAVAFYVGFKNNQAYDRLWEARQVWGSVTNSSRMWSSIVQALFGSSNKELAQQLIYRNIGWIYTLREQLLQSTQWEHVNGWHVFGTFNQKRRDKFGTGAFAKEVAQIRLKKYLAGVDPTAAEAFGNQAIYLLHQQTQTLQTLFEEKKIDWFKQVELQKIVNDMYEHQGKLERIKRFPLPRQYGSFSFIFTCIFIFLLPFALLGEFQKFGPAWIWLVIPAGITVGWVYVVMEMIGDYSENPFEGLPYDVPMLSICRNIEIDLLQMLGEQDLPAPIQARHGILM